MPAKSKAQQAVMGMALAARRGDMKVSELSDAAKKIYNSDMTDKEIEDFASTKHDGLPKYKSLKESILSSTNTGMKRINLETEELLKNNGATYTVKNGDIYVKYVCFNEEEYDGYGEEFEFPENNIKEIDVLVVFGLKSFKNFPKNINYLQITDSTIKDFNGCNAKNIVVNECNVLSLDGIDKNTIEYISLGGNKSNTYSRKLLSNKSVIKATGLKPDKFNVIGTAQLFKGIKSLRNEIFLNFDDLGTIVSVLNEYSEILKNKCNLVDVVHNVSMIKSSCVIFKIKINDKNIKHDERFISFQWNIQDNILEYIGGGHIPVTDDDKKDIKYKYWELKDVIDPYLDNGGKRFRKCRMASFDAKSIDNKISDWVCGVIDAVVKDQAKKK